MNTTKTEGSEPVAGPVERPVRPCAWTAHSWLRSRHGGHFVPERRPAFDVPLYDQDALDTAVAQRLGALNGLLLELRSMADDSADRGDVFAQRVVRLLDGA